MEWGVVLSWNYNYTAALQNQSEVVDRAKHHAYIHINNNI